MSGKALIIDKDPAFADQLGAALAAMGHSVEVCSTGREGMERARTLQPDVIVLCVELADTSGYSICAKIKKDDGLKAIPLVITSETATQETFDHHKKLRTRAQLYMQKPFEPRDLIRELGSLGVPLSGSSRDMPILDADELDELAADTSHHDALGGPTFEGSSIDSGAELDEVLASLSDGPGELGIDGEVGMQAGYDEDDVRTTIGAMPSGLDWTPLDAQPKSGLMALAPPDLVKRLKEAERARDEALAAERSTRAQLEALASGASQIPAANPATREVLAIKKDLNTKEREILELRDRLQEKDRLLLAAREREAELEERVVQTEESRSAADRARVEAESRIAGAEARAEEIERSSRAAIDNRDGQLDDARLQIDGLEQDLDRSRQQAEGLRDDVAARDATIEELQGEVSERDLALASRDARISDLEGTVHQRDEQVAGLEAELGRAREEILGLSDRIAGLERDLEESRSETDALRSALSDTEDRLRRAIARIRDDEDARLKARQALEITLNLLGEAEYAEDEAPLPTPEPVGLEN